MRWALTLFHAIRGDLRVYRERADELMIQAEQSGNPAFLMAAHHLVGVSLEFLGNMVESSQVLDRGRELHVPGRAHDLHRDVRPRPRHDRARDVEPSALGARLSGSRRPARARNAGARALAAPADDARLRAGRRAGHPPLSRRGGGGGEHGRRDRRALARVRAPAGNRVGPLVPGRRACRARPDDRRASTS